MVNNNWDENGIEERVVQALKDNFFDAVYYETAQKAADFIAEQIKEGDKVGFGGSATIAGMDILKKVLEKRVVVLDHNDPTLSKEEKLETRRQQLTCDLFLCSSNAVTLTGELVNVDCVGNRVSAMTFGPRKTIIAVGKNKICSDEKEAFIRIKTKAAPMNTKRLNWSNPCAETGICENCKSMSRGCRVYSVIRRKPIQSNITVVVIGEDLGY